jgi:hypothetical protein
VQVAAVGVYALVRAQLAPWLAPEADALFALVLGFALVGVTVLARRAGIPPVALATRRFAALLPLGIALVLPRQATGSAALMAGGSSLLYAALGAVERSRLLGSLGAFAANLALLIAALVWQVRGVEIYLAPFGLLVLMLGQIFGRTLDSPTRRLAQIVGGLLVYLPAAVELALRLGRDASGLYAVGFGAVCLLGVAAGMALRIRAYLALGTLFLALDVLANLLNAGLRDHRVGFWLLTLSGLAILGTMVASTLRREELRRLVARTRGRMRRWD